MCGIAGFLSLDRSSGRALSLERMTSAIRHRGPDDAGTHLDDFVALGHRRLSIIDLANGHQPMANEDRTAWIVFNGEIFNHADLRPDLEKAGHAYVTRCDTETILHAWEEYGPDCLSRFRGMFAFVIWDSRRNELFCARDRLGIKPLYYYWDGRLFAFASEIKALLEHPAISPTLEDSLLPEHLCFGYNSGERTLFRGIRKLMPGHYLRLQVRDGSIAFENSRYWDVPSAAATPGGPSDEREWIAECRRRLEETVRMRLMSDVPLGMFLSGGVDSSAIAALMARMVSTPVQTFAVGYAESAFSELGYARQAARAIGTDHHEVTVGMEEFFQTLPRLIWHEDEPIAWPSSVSLYFVSRLAASRVKVVLTGEGSDELFAGYARYRHYGWNSRYLPAWKLAPAPLRRALRSWISTTGLLPANARRKLQHTFLGAGETLETLYLDNFLAALSHSQQHDLLALPPSSEAVYSGYLEHWNAAAGRSPLERLLYADQKTYLVELLMKQDQMSMACSIESRVPFLDHPFVEFAARVPADLKLRGSTGKYIFKKAVEDLLPPGIVNRRKMGFPTPLRSWLLDRRAAPLLAGLQDPGGLLASFIDRPRLAALLEDHAAGRHDATDRIWRLLNLQIWGDLFLTGRGPGRWEDVFRTAPAAHASL